MNSPRRRWFRFSLRTLFVLVTVLAIPLGLFVSQQQIVRERKAMKAFVVRRDGIVCGPNEHFTIFTNSNVELERTGSARELDVIPTVPLARRFLGDAPVVSAWIPPAMSEREYAEFTRLFPESAILRGRWTAKALHKYQAEIEAAKLAYGGKQMTREQALEIGSHDVVFLPDSEFRDP